jgi:replication factor A1
VQEFRGQVEVAFNWRTRVEPAGEGDLPRVAPEDLPLRPLGELRARDDGVRVEGRVLEVRPKAVTVRGERRQVFEGVIADDSAARPFTAWTDFGLRPGEVVRVSGLYVREFRGRPQLTFDDRSRVERIDRRDLPPTEELAKPRIRTIYELERDRGGEFVATEGLVVGLLPTSGIIYRCPTCGRALSKGACRTHGAVTGTADLRARVALDDGSGVMTVNLNRELTEQVTGRTLEEWLSDLRAQPDPGRVEEEIGDRVFGRTWVVHGRASKDDFGVSFFPDRVRTTDLDVTSLVARARSRIAKGRR